MGVGERMGAAETPKRQTTCGWALSRATLLCLVQQLTVAADEDWTTVYHDTFTSEEIVAPAGAIVRASHCVKSPPRCVSIVADQRACSVD